MPYVAVLHVHFLASAIFVVPEVLDSKPVHPLQHILISEDEEPRVEELLYNEREELISMSLANFVHEVAARALDVDASEILKPKPAPKVEKPPCKNPHKLSFTSRKHHRSHHFLHHKFDDHCKEGIANVAMTACCQADCGECDDTSPVCENAAVNGRGSSCCPSLMLSATLPSCEVSHAPCAIPEYVRAPPNVNQLKSAAGVRNAYDDCGDVVSETTATLAVARQYIKIENKELVGATTQCLTQYGTIEQIANACGADDTCMGFTMKSDDDTPDCTLISGLGLEPTQLSVTHSTYLKRETTAGEVYHFVVTQWQDCSLPCGNGTTSRTFKCAAGGVEVNPGMCAAVVALNRDALPETQARCNTFSCTKPNITVGLQESDDKKRVSTVDTLREDLEPLNLFSLDSIIKEEKTELVPVDTSGYYFVGERRGLSFESSNVAWRFKVKSPDDCFPPPQGTTVVLFETIVSASNKAKCNIRAEALAAKGRPLGLCSYHIGVDFPPNVTRWTLEKADAANLLSEQPPSCGGNVLYFADSPAFYA